MSDTDAAAAALLERKRRSRTGHRSSSTRFVNQAKDVLASGTPDLDRLSLIKQLLIEKLETLKTLDNEIAEIIPEDKLEEEILGADEYKESVYRVLAAITKSINWHVPVSSTPSWSTN